MTHKSGVLLLAFVLGALACDSSDQTTGVVLQVSFEDTLTVASLELEARREDPPATVGPRPLSSERATKSGDQFKVLLPDAWDGRRTRFDVRGLNDAGKVLASGGAWGTPSSDDPPAVKITLAASCPADCTPGEARCVSDQVQRCVEKTPGCLTWAAPEDCPSDEPSCSNGLCAAQCKDECEGGQRRCASEGTAQVCGEHDSDSCLDWGSALACGPDELCQQGQCVLACDGKACPCKPGDTEPCADQGECKGGVRRCVGGQFGECEWQAGKQPEICDGKDNDCNGTEDDTDQLVAPACAKQQGVCKGAVKACGGAKGWLACGDADYAAHSPLYQADESTCGDGDNDCDGTEDEPASCCQPSCASKACGADNGCGSPCQSGSCSGANEHCQAGKCVCQPTCAGKACGADDGCGSPCQSGTCSGANQTCQAGKCVGTCSPMSPVVVDSTGDVGSYASVAIDASDHVHIGYYDTTNQDLKYATNAGGSWASQAVDSAGLVGIGPSLGVDAAGVAHLSYYHGGGYLKYASNGGGSWSLQTLHPDGAPAAESSLAIGPTGTVHISYQTLQAMSYVSNNSGSWQIETVDSGGKTGRDSSIAIDGTGAAHISFIDYDTVNLVKYATNRTGSWVISTIDPTSYPTSETSLALDAAGHVHVAYNDYQHPDQHLRYATNKGGSWAYAKINPSTENGTRGSLVIDANDKVHISYYDDKNEDLKYATNASGSWSVATVDAAGDQGWHSSVALDGNNRIHIGYYDRTNEDLKYTALCP